jgi:hypothetical protein
MANDPTPYPGPDDDDNDGADWLNDIRQNIRTARQRGADWLSMAPAAFSDVPVQGALFPESDAAPAPVMF